MDCIFKINGYIPKNHVCTRCQPLETLLVSAGCRENEATTYSKSILRAFTLIKLEDTFRDEALPRRILAKAQSVLHVARLPKATRQELERADATVRRLESSNADASTYIEQVAEAGGSIFERVAGASQLRTQLHALGSTLTGAILIQDMMKDLKDDEKTGKFNPLKNCDTVLTETLAKRYIHRFRAFADPLLKTKPVNPKRIEPLGKLVRCGECCTATGLPDLCGC